MRNIAWSKENISHPWLIWQINDNLLLYVIIIIIIIIIYYYYFFMLQMSMKDLL